MWVSPDAHDFQAGALVHFPVFLFGSVPRTKTGH
jgi:hypothetical protein